MQAPLKQCTRPLVTKVKPIQPTSRDKSKGTIKVDHMRPSPGQPCIYMYMYFSWPDWDARATLTLIGRECGTHLLLPHSHSTVECCTTHVQSSLSLACLSLGGWKPQWLVSEGHCRERGGLSRGRRPGERQGARRVLGGVITWEREGILGLGKVGGEDRIEAFVPCTWEVSECCVSCWESGHRHGLGWGLGVLLFPRDRA